MSAPQWMIYGAYGHTGTLVAQEALRRGHRPLLAGRSSTKLAPLADSLGLPWVALDLQDAPAVRGALRDVGLVFHAAGPFAHTSAALVQASLASRTHYLDISGEVAVHEHSLSQDKAARRAGIALISGVGLDVLATDCLVRYVADKLPDATSLDIAIAMATPPSRGTLKTLLERLWHGSYVRRNGVLVRVPPGRGARRIRFPHGERVGLPISWGDLVTAYRTTGIPNVTTYLANPAATGTRTTSLAPLTERALALAPIRRIVLWWLERRLAGSHDETPGPGRSYVWVRASNPRRVFAEAWLETSEAYVFTASAGVRAVERVFALDRVGAYTPSLAFGADFILEVENTHRYDTLPP